MAGEIKAPRIDEVKQCPTDKMQTWRCKTCAPYKFVYTETGLRGVNPMCTICNVAMTMHGRPIYRKTIAMRAARDATQAAMMREHIERRKAEGPRREEHLVEEGEL